MGELGCDLLMICSNVAPDSLGGIDRAAADFHQLGERAHAATDSRGIRGAGLGTTYQRLPRRVGGGAPRRSSGDRAHARQLSYPCPARPTSEAIRSIPADKIVLVQLADAPWLDMDVMSWSRHFRCFPGQGDFPLTRVHGRGRRDRLSAAWSRSRSSTISSARAPRATFAIDGQRSLVYPHATRCAAASARSARPLLPCLPAPSVSASSFSNSQPTSRSAAALAALLAGAGIRPGRPAPVEIRHPLGARRRSTSSSTATATASRTRISCRAGPSVCAICLKVEDATATARPGGTPA